MFVFGAGASFDSDPKRRPRPGQNSWEVENRPPLAKDLFSPEGMLGARAIESFPRARPLLMRLRDAAERGLDVEQELERFEAESESYPLAKVQSLALRGYLAELLSEVPTAWAQECQGRTNYVLALDEAARWSSRTGHRVACVTFNYDTLLEDAATSVHGIKFVDTDSYTANDSLVVYKPHGSTTWRQSARWDAGAFYSGRTALDLAIDHAAELEWLPDIEVAVHNRYQDDLDPNLAYLPALTIPVQSKSDFMMPTSHRTTLEADLGQVATLVAVGWRGREQHFLDLLRDHLPSKPSRLVVVSETVGAAMETVDSLWTTGRFDAYALCSSGFSGFVSSRPDTLRRRIMEEAGRAIPSELYLNELLGDEAPGGGWTNRAPGK